MRRLSPNVLGALVALTAFAAFSVHDVIVKALGASYSPVQIVFFSALLGFPFLTIMMIRDAEPGTLRPRHPRWVALRTVLTTLGAVATFYTFTVLPLTQAYAILFAAPLLITLLSIPMLGEKVGPRRFAAVAVGLCGVIWVLQPGVTQLTLGHAAGVTAAVCMATGAIIMRRIGREERSAVMMLYPMLSNIVVMGCALPFVYQPMPILHLAGLAAIAAIAFVSSSGLIAAYRQAEAVVVAPMQYSQIVWAAIFGLLFFGEAPGFDTILGAAVIIASGIYIVLRENSEETSGIRPVTQARPRPDAGGQLRMSSLMRSSQMANRPRHAP